MPVIYIFSYEGLSYGHLTWEWDKGIRSYIYPGLIALLYKILAFLDLDTVENLVSIFYCSLLFLMSIFFVCSSFCKDALVI